MRIPARRLRQVSLACLAGSMAVCLLTACWLTPLTGLALFGFGPPLFLAGILGYAIGVIADLE